MLLTLWLNGVFCVWLAWQVRVSLPAVALCVAAALFNFAWAVG